MTLEQWQQNRWLNPSEAKLAEITQLFAVVDREIADASIKEISIDGRFMHAYDAAFKLCAIALRTSGYTVVKGQGHHKKTIESLSLTLGAEFQGISDQIELASRRRGEAICDRVGVVEEVDATELLQAAIEVRATMIEWLRTSNVDLVPKQYR